MVGRHLDEHERQAVGITGDHLEQSPGPDGRLLLDWDAPRREALAHGAQVAHLEEQSDGARRRPDRCTRDLEEPAAEEEDDPALAPRPQSR